MVHMTKMNADTIVGGALILIALWMSLDALVTSHRRTRRATTAAAAAQATADAAIEAVSALAARQSSPFGPVASGTIRPLVDAVEASLDRAAAIRDGRMPIPGAERQLANGASVPKTWTQPEPPQTIPLPLHPDGTPAPDPTEPRNMDRERLGIVLDRMVRDGMTHEQIAHALGLTERRIKAVLLQHWTRMAGLPTGGYELDLIPSGGQ